MWQIIYVSLDYNNVSVLCNHEILRVHLSHIHATLPHSYHFERVHIQRRVDNGENVNVFSVSISNDNFR